MLNIILIVIVLLIAGVLVLAAAKPDIFRVERKTVVNAPPEKVFALINDFKQWSLWSPWDKKDPAMKRNMSADTAGKGATYAWEGNKEVGIGSMEITDSAAPSRIRIKLDFAQPFEAHNLVTFTLTPQDKGTEVSWAMEGPTPYFAKIIHVFMNMDRMVGKDFEAGLAAIKAAAEK